MFGDNYPLPIWFQYIYSLKLCQAWRLWEDDKALDLAEPALRKTCNANEFLRCVNVGLLCVQEDPCVRPTMSDVLFMLGSETASLPIPEQPAYVVRRALCSSASSTNKQQWNSELTASLEEGRWLWMLSSPSSCCYVSSSSKPDSYVLLSKWFFCSVRIYLKCITLFDTLVFSKFLSRIWITVLTIIAAEVFSFF